MLFGAHNGNGFASVGFHLFLQGSTPNHFDQPFGNLLHTFFLNIATAALAGLYLLRVYISIWNYNGHGCSIPFVVVMAIIQ
jgi:hypothetical protein